jgi:glycosyltransferase involved in cell wall biosynthesis
MQNALLQPKPGTLAALVRKARRRARLFLRGEHPRFYFDLDDAEQIARIMHERLDASPREAAFSRGDRVRGEQVYELRDDLRREFPLAFTPAQRGHYFQWFCRHGRHETDAAPLDVLRLLFEHDGAPDRGLAAAYLVQPGWQERYPDALTPAGWGSFKQAIAAEYHLRGRWLRRARLPREYAESKPLAAGELGVNAIGLFRYTSGLQQAAQAAVDALAGAGVRIALRDVPMAHHRDGRGRSGFTALERFPITLINTGLDLPVPEVYRLAGLHRRPGIYRIAMWWWELEELPEAWRGRGADVDEIWAPTSFIASALRPLGKPVYPMLPSVRLPAFEPKPKAAFGLAVDRFTFLFAFDMNSRMPRKNPLGLIRAFRLAFKPSEPVELAIKVSPQERFYPEWWRELRTAAAESGVKLIDRNLARGDLLALMNAADAYVSLHRSEGFGLTMAEAMLLGKPTIATGYSGNLDFMTDAVGYQVRRDLTRIAEDIPPYPKGCVWAEPCVEDAARQMRRVFDNRSEAAGIAARGQAHVRALLSPEAAAGRMVRRLREIQSMKD